MVTFYGEEVGPCWDCANANAADHGEDVQPTVLRDPDTGRLVADRPMCRKHREDFHSKGYVVYTVAV